MTYDDLKSEIRIDDIKHDPWGTAISWHFVLCDQLAYRDEIAPLHKWQYRPGGGNWTDPRQDDDYQHELFDQCSTSDLVKFGELLSRYTRLCDHLGQSY